jgi:WD40 repeat protein
MSDVVLRSFEQDETYFGAGGSRRGTHVDDGLRVDYFHTRLGLLGAVEAARPPEYYATRAALLKRSFSKRRTNREVVSTALREQELEATRVAALAAAAAAAAAETAVATATVPPKPKRFKVVDEYAFTGMHLLFDHHQTSVTRLAFANGDRSLLAMGCSDGSASVARTDGLSNGEQIAGRHLPYRLIPKRAGAVCDLAWSGANEWLLVGYSKGGAVLYDAVTFRILRAFELDACSCVCFHPANSNHVLLASLSGSCVIYNASTGSVVASIATGEPVTACCWPSDAMLWLGTQTGKIMSYRVAGAQCTRTLVVTVRVGSPVNSLSFHSWLHRKQRIREVLVSLPGTGQTVAVYRLYDDGTLRPTAAFRVPNKGLALRSCFCPLTPSSRDGACIVAASEDCGVRIYDICRFGNTSKKPLINALEGHTAPVLDVCWSFDETLLASSDLSGLVILWKRREIEMDD